MVSTELSPSFQVRMDPEEVVRIVRLMDAHGIFLCLDGGWAMDALLGEQTRPHKDLDVALHSRDLPRLLELLAESGYQHLLTRGEWEHNFVLADSLGHQVDLHTFVMDDDGKIVGGVDYPPESLTGQGMILDQEVRCIEAVWLVDFHGGYTLDTEDYHDVCLLCKQFGIPLPVEYRRSESGDGWKRWHKRTAASTIGALNPGMDALENGFMYKTD